MADNYIIEIKDIHKTFGKKDGKVEALRGIDIAFCEGEMTAVMGKSGSGKSTLLNIIGGIMSFDSGQYIYKGKPLDLDSRREITKFRRREIGFVVQYFALVDDLNVFQNVALPLKYMGVSGRNIKKRVMEALTELDIKEKAKAYPNELSGGQQQRVAIARAIVKNPELILADEPTGALDEATGESVQDIFRELNNKGKTVIIVTHDEKVAEKCDRIIRIKDGVVDDTYETGKESDNKGESV